MNRMNPKVDKYLNKAEKWQEELEKLKVRRKIGSFDKSNKASINKLSRQIFTIDFLTGKKSKTNYSKAKIIDIYGFTVGITK